MSFHMYFGVVAPVMVMGFVLITVFVTHWMLTGNWNVFGADRPRSPSQQRHITALKWAGVAFVVMLIFNFVVAYGK